MMSIAFAVWFPWFPPAWGVQAPAPLESGLRAISGFDRLIMDEGVKKELKLSDEQLLKAKEVVHEIRQSHGPEFEAILRGAEGEDRGRKAAAILQRISNETIVRFKGILQPQQIARLKQIELQERGLRAFSDPDVERALGLTREQKAKIKEISEQAEQKMHEALQRGQKGQNLSSTLQKLLAARRDMLEKAEQALTADQKKTWSGLAGPPFEFRIERRGGK
jgi:hypothetical protein